MRALLLALSLLALGSCISSQAGAADWRELPVVPTLDPRLAGHLEKVAARGDLLGNRPRVFAKVGDSITASPSFLQALSCGSPRLGRWSELRPTLRFFGGASVPRGLEETSCPVSNSYSRLGLAAAGGWRTADALLPRESFPQCERLPAIACELRLLRPSIALIMFGTNDLKDVDASRFRRDLARVARLVSGAGTIPVISTIPPRARWPFSQRVGRFNAAIVELADNRALPLWNYWRQLGGPRAAAGALSADGVHPSVLCPPCTAIDFRPGGLWQGYALRNLGALRVLDRLRREILPAGTRRQPS